MLTTWLLQVQKVLIARKGLIERFFLSAELAILIIWVMGDYWFVTDRASHIYLYDFGRNFGQLALIFYLSTLVPGIMQRLQWLPMVGAMIMPFRRHLGIMMFALAFVHFSWTTSLFIVFGGAPLVLSPGQLAGATTFAVLFPLWLTSNDPAQRFLGKNWKRLHRLTYVGLAGLFLHMLLFQKNWLVPVGIMAALEAWSWWIAWRRLWAKQAAAKTAPTPLPMQSQTGQTE